MSERDPIDSGIVDWIFDDLVRARFPRLTDQDLGILARILARPCPSCQATAGRWCRTPSGHEIQDMDRQHLSRRDLRSGTS
ncbi:hypothetical protein [Actinopolymorpha sp. B9G3]|uniref:zinc finger domain-containing protein n=1 Tax=Actinopolymorpha sp. B9G3 TaxID=3158970 RepID=UPI0032D8F1B4